MEFNCKTCGLKNVSFFCVVLTVLMSLIFLCSLSCLFFSISVVSKCPSLSLSPSSSPYPCPSSSWSSSASYPKNVSNLMFLFGKCFYVDNCKFSTFLFEIRVNLFFDYFLLMILFWYVSERRVQNSLSQSLIVSVKRILGFIK